MLRSVREMTRKGVWLALWLALLPRASRSLSYCPEGCLCVVRADLRILMNCSGVELRKFPPEAPSLDLVPSPVSMFDEPGYTVEIDLSRNSVSEAYFPSALKQTTRIDLSFNKIASLNDVVVADLEELKELDLSHNERLDRLADLRSRSLEVLNVAHCSVRELEEGFLERVPSVRSLDISDNSLVELGPFSKHFPKEVEVEALLGESLGRKRTPLVHLNASHNSIRRVHGRDMAGSEIKVLDVSDNQLTQVRFTVFLRHLEELNVSRNSVASLDGLAAPNVVVLDVSVNDVRDVRVDFDAKAPKLRKLDLSRNPIRTVPRIKSSSVRELGLGFCEIDSVEAGAFSRMEHLDRLDLSGNKLTTLDGSLFSGDRLPGVLSLGQNPWNCDCDSPEFRSLLELVVSRKDSLGRELRCRNDPSLAWPLSCRRPSDVVLGRRQSFYVFLYLLVALFSLLLLYACYRCARSLSQRASHSIPSSGTDDDEVVASSASETTRSDAPARVPPRFGDAGEESSSSSSSSSMLRRSTPPPNYETAILLPQLSEEDREKAISSLSLRDDR